MTVLTPEQVATYENLYLRRPPHFIVWFEVTGFDYNAAFTNLRRRRRQWKHGVRPNVRPDQPPQFNRLIENVDKTVALEFASGGDMKIVRSGYDNTFHIVEIVSGAERQGSVSRKPHALRRFAMYGAVDSSAPATK